MTTYGAVETWGSGLRMPTGVPRLTRRGRLLRAGVIAVMLAWVTALLVANVTTAPGTHVAPSSAPVAASRVVTVQEGDSLWAIARDAQPGRDPREVVSAIREMNGLPSNLIHPGQELVVPLAA